MFIYCCRNCHTEFEPEETLHDSYDPAAPRGHYQYTTYNLACPNCGTEGEDEYDRYDPVDEQI
jgi:rubredoxin